MEPVYHPMTHPMTQQCHLIEEGAGPLPSLSADPGLGGVWLPLSTSEPDPRHAEPSSWGALALLPGVPPYLCPGPPPGAQLGEGQIAEWF